MCLTDEDFENGEIDDAKAAEIRHNEIEILAALRERWTVSTG